MRQKLLETKLFLKLEERSQLELQQEFQALWDGQQGLQEAGAQTAQHHPGPAVPAPPDTPLRHL